MKKLIVSLTFLGVCISQVSHATNPSAKPTTPPKPVPPKHTTPSPTPNQPVANPTPTPTPAPQTAFAKIAALFDAGTTPALSEFSGEVVWSGQFVFATDQTNPAVFAAYSTKDSVLGERYYGTTGAGFGSFKEAIDFAKTPNSHCESNLTEDATAKALVTLRCSHIDWQSANSVTYVRKIASSSGMQGYVTKTVCMDYSGCIYPDRTYYSGDVPFYGYYITKEAP